MNTYSFEKLVINTCYFFGVTRYDRGVHHLTHAVACSNHECYSLINMSLHSFNFYTGRVKSHDPVAQANHEAKLRDEAELLVAQRQLRNKCIANAEQFTVSSFTYIEPRWRGV